MSGKARMVWTACLAVGLIWNGPAWALDANQDSVAQKQEAEVAQMNPTYPIVLSRGIVGATQTETEEDDGKYKKRKIKLKGFDKDKTWITYKNYFQRGFVGPEVEPVGEVVQGMRNHIVFTPVQYIFVEFETNDEDRVNVKVGDRFRVVDQSETQRHPNKTFGITDYSEVDDMNIGYIGEFAYALEFRQDPVGQKFKIKGVVEVVGLAPQGGVAKVKVLEGFAGIVVGDWLVPMPREKPDMIKVNYEPPVKNIRGFLLGNKNSRIISSFGDELYIDKGAADNVAVGDRFEVYIVPGREDWFGDELTEHVVADLMVISTQEETSTFIIINQTEPLLPGQKIRSKQ